VREQEGEEEESGKKQHLLITEECHQTLRVPVVLLGLLPHLTPFLLPLLPLLSNSKNGPYLQKENRSERDSSHMDKVLPMEWFSL